MTASRTHPTRFAALAFVAPLALALSACGGEAEGSETGVTAGDPIADIAAPEGSAWVDTVTVTDEGGYKLGNPEAPINLVEYASHTCGACAQFATTAKEPLKEYVESGVVSFEQRKLIRGFDDMVFAALVQCGPKETMQPLSDQAWGSFNEVMQGFADREQIQSLAQLPPNERFVRAGEVTGLIDFFASRGLSSEKARECLADTDKLAGIQDRSNEQAKKYGVTGTPTFFLNGERVTGISWTDVEAALKRAGARDE